MQPASVNSVHQTEKMLADMRMERPLLRPGRYKEGLSGKQSLVTKWLLCPWAFQEAVHESAERGKAICGGILRQPSAPMPPGFLAGSRDVWEERWDFNEKGSGT